LRGYAASVAEWFGQEPRLSFLPFEEWRRHVTPEEASITWDHIAHSPNGSIEKARKLLDYQPRYSSLEAVKESVRRLIAAGEVEAPAPWADDTRRSS
jgi:nucleoside-diphosphate-sugar epimerase